MKYYVYIQSSKTGKISTFVSADKCIDTIDACFAATKVRVGIHQTNTSSYDLYRAEVATESN